MLTVGQTFARYVIEAAIGEGGMGEVYRAFDDKLRRKVALKVLHPDLAVPDAAARLVREARAAAAFAHPNTIAIYDLGEIDGTVFLVMELISGAPLRAYIGDPSVPATKKLRWLVDIARGLGAAHKAGLVHRDVKPANVMVSDDGVVKVLDFGLAKPVEAASLNTDVGLVVGTPRYMAPELFTGIRADARSDQYAFGVTAYELLAGVHPGSPMGAVPAALDTLVPELGPTVARIIGRTLSRDPADRFASMNEVATALEEQIVSTRVSQAVEARDASPSPATKREGAIGATAAGLALAPTELPSSVAASPSPSPAPAPSSRSSVGPVVVALGLLVAGAGYGASRFLGASAVAATDGPSTASDASDESSASALATNDALDGAADAAATLVDALDAGVLDAAADPDASDADAAATSDATTTHTLPLDEFADPWTRPAPAASAR
ncbi:MAG: Serine/threonine protein kinase [Myxococcaceae bacterium]|nr:Serine/threonine protein kinase [Myxococcaceae bacterium]